MAMFSKSMKRASLCSCSSWWFCAKNNLLRGSLDTPDPDPGVPGGGAREDPGPRGSSLYHAVAEVKACRRPRGVAACEQKKGRRHRSAAARQIRTDGYSSSRSSTSCRSLVSSFSGGILVLVYGFERPRLGVPDVTFLERSSLSIRFMFFAPFP